MKSLFLSVFLASALPAQACQLSLMFSIDTSGSINADEWDLQTGGLAQALGDPDIAFLILSQQAHLSAFQWSGDGQSSLSVPWTSIASEGDLAAFANRIASLPRQWSNGKTAIGSAMTAMLGHFQSQSHCARKVIDLSGDGVSNDGIEMRGPKALLEANGIMLNGLAIEPYDKFAVDGFKSLDVYYRSQVIVGRGAFVEAADGYEDYPRAIHAKLLNELVKPSS